MSLKCLPTKFDSGIQLFKLNISGQDTSHVPDWRLGPLTFKNLLVSIDGSTVILLCLWRDACIVTRAQCGHLLRITCCPEGKTPILLPEIYILGINVEAHLNEVHRTYGVTGLSKIVGNPHTNCGVARI